MHRVDREMRVEVNEANKKGGYNREQRKDLQEMKE